MEKKTIGFILNETCYRITSPGQWQLFVRVSAITSEGVRLDLEQPHSGPHTLWKVDRETLPVGEGLDLTLDRLDGETDSFRVFADDQSGGMATLRFEYPEHLIMEMHQQDRDPE